MRVTQMNLSYNNFTASQVESNGIHGSPAVTDSLRG